MDNKMTPVEIAGYIKQLNGEEMMELMVIMVNHFVTMTADEEPGFREKVMNLAIPMVMENIK